MSNEQIVEQIQNGINVTENQERLWLKNRKFVLMIIKQYCGFTEDLDDLEQQGFLGLITAAMKFRPDKGTKFITYSAYWIKQSIFRYNEACCGSIRVPAYMKANIRKYERYRQECKNQNGRFPTDEEMCIELGISHRSLESLERTIHNMRCVSLDAPAAGSEDDSGKALDSLADDQDIEGAVTYSVYRKELHEELNQAMEPLDRDTRGMVYSIYYQGNTVGRTAAMFRCSRQNVHEKIGKGFYQILHSSNRSRLEGFMGEGFRYREKTYSNYADLEEVEHEFIV